MALKRNIGTLGLLFASVGGIVGSGWLFAPLYAAQNAGPASIISWVIGFILILILALSFAEVSSMLPLAGGVVHFIKLSHGSPASFIISWLNWVAFVMIPSIEVQATLQYTAHFWPQLTQSTAGGQHPLTATGFGMAAVLMLIFNILNTVGIRFVIRLNSIVVWWKLIIPLTAIITLICYRFSTQNFTSHSFAPSGLNGIFSAVTAGGIIFSLIGFRQAIELAQEAKNPGKSLPIALIGSLVIALILFLALQISFIGVMKPADLANGWSHISFSGEAGPFLDIAGVLGIVWLVGLLYIDAIISPAGTAIIFTASTARIVYAMADAGVAPKVLLKTNKYGVPFMAIIINFIAGMLFFLPFPNWQSMASFLAGMSVLAYAVGPVSMYALRKQASNKLRPFKLRMPFITGLVGFIAAILIILWSGWSTMKAICSVTVIGLIFLMIYIISTKLKKPDRFKILKQELIHGSWIILSVLFLAFMSYYGSFGGTKAISTGWDVGITAIGAIALYCFAYLTRLSGARSQAHLDKIDLT
jgi:amino acid transporter